MNELIYCNFIHVKFWNYIATVNCFRPYKQNLRLLKQWELVSSPIFMLTPILSSVNHSLHIISVLKPNLPQSISDLPLQHRLFLFLPSTLNPAAGMHPGKIKNLKSSQTPRDHYKFERRTDSGKEILLFLRSCHVHYCLNYSAYPDNQLNMVYLLFPPCLVIM